MIYVLYKGQPIYFDTLAEAQAAIDGQVATPPAQAPASAPIFVGHTARPGTPLSTTSAAAIASSQAPTTAPALVSGAPSNVVPKN